MRTYEKEKKKSWPRSINEKDILRMLFSCLIYTAGRNNVFISASIFRYSWSIRWRISLQRFRYHIFYFFIFSNSIFETESRLSYIYLGISFLCVYFSFHSLHFTFRDPQRFLFYLFLFNKWAIFEVGKERKLSVRFSL